MPVPPQARLLPTPGAGRSEGEGVGQHRHLAALGILGTAPAIDRE
jgi:hypothetical protein